MLFLARKERTMVESAKQKPRKTEMHLLAKFCSDVVADTANYSPERAAKASKLHREWSSLQHLVVSSPKEGREKEKAELRLYERMKAFQNETK
jgi:hypothetical protein